MNKNTIVPNERIINKIVLLRGEKVILDVHLAELYDVETRILKQAVRRNIERFPEDFMFKLSEKEIKFVVSQNVIPSKKHFGGATPFAFTETGVAMLSSVLRSKKAIEMNITIVRTFVHLRKLVNNYEEMIAKMQEMELNYNEQFSEIYQVLQQLLSKPKEESRPKIGYKKDRT
ncbi:MAG: ORF6N domain-containing protein [Flavobacteriaceae bacterium]|nr:ORF6N domain-containing protein [Flavobacteriaceae bacterium]